MQCAWERFERGCLAHAIARALICIFFLDCGLERYQNWKFYRTDLMKERIENYPHRYQDPGKHVLPIDPQIRAVHALCKWWLGEPYWCRRRKNDAKYSQWAALLSWRSQTVIQSHETCWKLWLCQSSSKCQWFIPWLGLVVAGFPYFDLFVIVPCALLTMVGINTWLTAGLLVVDMLRDSIGIIITGM